MKTHRYLGRAIRQVVCLALAVTIGTSPSLSALAQTNAAAMAVRQRVEGLENAPGPEGQPSQLPPGGQGPGPGPTVSAEPSPGKLDTRYITPTSSMVIVARPAQIMASPLAQIFPVEVASAATMKQLGFDTTEIEEAMSFVDMSNPTAPAFGTTFKFKNPIRASSLPVEMRVGTQLAELGGKKYLRNAIPMKPSLYGPNNKTLVAATDAALRKMVESAGQPKTGPMMDRLREVASGADLYIAVDAAALRPYLQMGLAQLQLLFKMSPEVKQQLAELLNDISAVELTLNASVPGPTSLVMHCNDDAAAQKVEATAQAVIQKLRAATQSEQPAGDDPFAQGMSRYQERMWQLVQPQRNGTSVTCLRVDGQNAGQQQLVAAGIIAVVGAIKLGPMLEAGRGALRGTKGGRATSGPQGPAGAPGSPDAGQPAN